jgi:4-amino-4-deoxy-L-arabinose transferase-like glycosyltransferase
MTGLKSSRFDTFHVVAVGLAFFSFFMAALVSRTTFERLPHLEDELAYLYQARIFAAGDVVVEIPQPRRAFWQPFVIDYPETGNRFGKYPPGWPLLLAGGVHLGPLWVVNAFFAALNVIVIYRLGREVFNPDAGLIAAALTAFSPMALLLNASLMAHTSALFFFTLFMWCYWRMESNLRRHRGRSALRWGLAAGIALGLLVINRPLTSVSLAAPFVLWSGLRVLRAAYDDWRARRAYRLQLALRPLLALAAVTLLISMAVPLFNHAATGDPTKNLYTLVWPYDRVGFGSCCGRSSLQPGGGHTIIRGILHTRFDLSLTAADLFGWQAGTITPELQEHLRTQSNYWPVVGLSFLLLPPGLLVGFGQRWLAGWLLLGMAWLLVPLALDMDFLRDANNQTTAWVWLGALGAWLLIPPLILGLRQDYAPRPAWTWLLLAAAVALIGIHLAYWVGSQRYSTRYYAEALTTLALIGALPVAWLARRTSRMLVYGLLAATLLWSLYAYSAPRIDALYRFNRVSPQIIEQIEARREDDRPTLVIVTGERGAVSWRALGSLMAHTGPHLDDDIVTAWDYAPGTEIRQLILERFPDRQVIEMAARADRSWFLEVPCQEVAADRAELLACLREEPDETAS